MSESPSISIKPMAKHHGQFVFILGVLMLLCDLLIANFFWQQLKLVLIFILLISLVLILFGIVKLYEPNQSLILTPYHLQFFHRYGHWQLPWSNIRYISKLTTSSGLQQTELPYIGIVLNDLQHLIDSISPRLASRLIHEQRPLLIHSISQHLMLTEQAIINFSPYKLANNKLVTGPLAGFLHHTNALYSALGYHLFIPQNSLDRDITDFVQLLNQCKRSAVNYQTE